MQEKENLPKNLERERERENFILLFFLCEGKLCIK